MQFPFLYVPYVSFRSLEPLGVFPASDLNIACPASCGASRLRRAAPSAVRGTFAVCVCQEPPARSRCGCRAVSAAAPQDLFFCRKLPSKLPLYSAPLACPAEKNGRGIFFRTRSVRSQPLRPYPLSVLPQPALHGGDVARNDLLDIGHSVEQVGLHP